MPTQEEFERLKEWTSGVQLACVWDVDTPARRIKMLEQQTFVLGHNKSDARKIPQQKKEKLIRLLHCGRQRGLSLRDLGFLYGMSHSTVGKWLDEV